MDFVFQDGMVLWQDTLVDQDIYVSDGRICEKANGPLIDATGYMILPGIVDIHGDGFERHLAPRRGAVKDLVAGLIACEAELAANGITTAVLAQFYSWEGGMRSPKFAYEMLGALEYVAPHLATALIPQLRFEYLMMDHWDAFLALTKRFSVPYVVLNDHVPHAALSKGKKPPRLTGQALKSGRSPEAHLLLLQALHAQYQEVRGKLPKFVKDLQNQKILIGSHDDATAAERQFFHDLGVTTSEFPETHEAAQRAQELGSHIVMGAPNLLRGGSHTGNLNAQDIIGQGLDALASDYHYPAPRLSALNLSNEIGFEQAWAYVSKNPARVLGLTDRGTLDLTKRADMIVLNKDTKKLEATIANGRFTYLTGEISHRVLVAK